MKKSRFADLAVSLSHAPCTDMRSLLLIGAVFTLLSDAAKTVKVFGAGLSKTGTTSLAAALTELGYDTIHTDAAYIPIMLSPRTVRHAVHAALSIATTHTRQAFDYRGLYDRVVVDAVTAAADLPTALFYTELLQAYPSAKLVLTVRDTESWYRSFSSHMVDHHATYDGYLSARMRRTCEAAYGTCDNNREAWVQHYLTNHASVVRSIPRSQLLVRST